ncbi:hypothetical protein CF327_g5973 [Tilletia walkeri]|nr:hypothetical protein CF327_g5973 [Tilletia walkeri]
MTSSLAFASGLRRSSLLQYQHTLIFRRSYATPINSKSSLEPALGTAPPSTPTDTHSINRERWLNNISSSSSTTNNNIQKAKETLLRTAPPQQQPQPKPQQTPTHTLRERVLEAARIIANSSTTSTATVEHLQERYNTRAGKQLTIELPYESTPTPERRVPGTSPSSTAQADEDDGVLLLAYISDLDASRPKVSLCSAFPIAVDASQLDPVENEPVGQGALAITCAHTLTTALPEHPSKGGEQTPSVALALTRRGHVYAVRTLLSSLPQSDILLLQLSEQPILSPSKPAPQGQGFFARNRIAPPSFAPTSHEHVVPSLRTLPLSPYPAQPDEVILVSSFDGWDASAHSQNSPGGAYDAAEGSGRAVVDSKGAMKRWGEARILEYKDGAGREARVGTYDDLHQLDFRLLSAPAHNRPKIASVTVPMPTSSSEAEVNQPFTSPNQDLNLNLRDGMNLLNRSLANLSSPTPSKSPAESQQPQGGAGTPSAFPPPGSSGGPIVSSRDGSVVGVVRGSRSSVLEGHRGDGVPAEKIFEMFALPGLGKKILAARKKGTSGKSSEGEQKAEVKLG